MLRGRTPASDVRLMSSLTRRLAAPSGTSLRSWLPFEAELLRRITNRLDCPLSVLFVVH